MIYPDLDQYRKMCEEYSLIPVWREVRIDMDTPISIFRKTARQRGAYLLESVEGGENLARYSFIGLEPFLEFTFKGGEGSVSRGGVISRLSGKPLECLEDFLASFRAPQLEDLPRFYGGAVGYFGYDLVRSWEVLPAGGTDDLEMPDCRFVFARIVLIIDHVKHQMKIVYNSSAGADPESAYREAAENLERITGLVMSGEASFSPRLEDYQVKDFPPGKGLQEPQITSNLTRAEYMARVEQAKEYIKSGDIFQVVLSQRFQAPLTIPPFELYRSLRSLNPAPYLYYLELGEDTIIGSSPEMLVRVEDQRVETCPIAGTRPRGRNAQEDTRLAAELAADEKEKAEHLMLVDLGRNDLGRVSEYGTVKVSQFMKVEKYSHVMHMVSLVEGHLKEGQGNMDALRACFPAGTVSGAPKVRAMEIIAQLEPHNRGPYAGAIGYFSFTGNMDTCITIRTIVVRDGQVYVQAGAGIVADSDPATEYQETVNKAMALLKALRLQDKGLALA
ncbi:MAG TPA: anthranilate synthase component I [Bacillota bacterium]|nr:anthranilate synthase component I [Bacillota bacterium]